MQHLSRIEFDDLKSLILELVTLLTFMYGQRNPKLLSLIILDNIEITYDVWIIRIGDPLKTNTTLFHNDEFKFPVYPEDQPICPVFHIREFIKRIENVCQYCFKFCSTAQTSVPGLFFEMEDIIGSRD